MRRFLTFVAILCYCALLAGCRGASGPSADWRDKTHNVRVYAPMSMPAFLPDGSKFVANGTKLLKFSAGDALLDTIELPIIPANQYSTARVISSKAGSVFVLLGDGRVGRVNAAGLFEWLQDFRASCFGAVAFGDGILATCFESNTSQATMIGSDGKIKLQLATASFMPESDSTADTGHAFFLARNSLWVADTSGAWLLKDQPIDSLTTLGMSWAAAGRVLLFNSSEPRGLYCCDLNGDIIWNAPWPATLTTQSRGMLFTDGTVLISVLDEHLWQYSVLLYGSDGSPRAQLAGLTIYAMSMLDTDRFAGIYSADGKMQYGLFTKVGELLWGAPWPTTNQPGHYNPWDDRTNYLTVYDCFCGQDQRIYFEWESTLHALDLQGLEVWREAGHEYTDKEVPNSSGKTNPGTQPPIPATGGTKPTT